MRERERERERDIDVYFKACDMQLHNDSQRTVNNYLVMVDFWVWQAAMPRGLPAGIHWFINCC